jgi:hypothetical protein
VQAVQEALQSSGEETGGAYLLEDRFRCGLYAHVLPFYSAQWAHPALATAPLQSGWGAVRHGDSDWLVFQRVQLDDVDTDATGMPSLAGMTRIWHVDGETWEVSRPQPSVC